MCEMYKTSSVIKVITSLFLVLAFLSPALAQEKPDIFVQMGHSYNVYSVSFSPDGRYIASGSYADSEVPILAEQVFKRAQYPTAQPTGQAFPVGKVK